FPPVDLRAVCFVRAMLTVCCRKKLSETFYDKAACRPRAAAVS
ncbi:hypothetical protein THAOC_24668, partial [Thalassiosira oceanica]